MNISRTRRSEEEDQHMNNKDNDTFSGQVDGDLVMNILYRLPPFTVHRFRLVCKYWYSLILNPDFLRMHSSFQFQQHHEHTTTTTGHRLLVSNKSRSCPLNKHVVFVDLPEYDDEYYRYRYGYRYGYRSWSYSLRIENPFLDLYPSAVSAVFPEYLLDCHIIDACNGLFLLNCATYPKEPDGNFTHKDINHTNYYICNPITKHYLKLPTIEEEDQEVLGDVIPSVDPNLVFDPLVSLSYKVVKCLIRRIPDGIRCWKIYVYSSETRAWRLSFTRYLYNYLGINFKSRGVLLNGILYWSYHTLDKDVSHCFDVEKENVCSLSLPPKDETTFVRILLYFGEHGGCLRLIEKHLRRESHEFNDIFNRLPNSFDIMETEPQQQEDGNVHCIWTVKYRVNIETVFRHYGIKKEASVIHCYKLKTRRGSKEEEEDALLLKLNDRNIVSFKLNSKEIGNEIAISEIKCCIQDFRDVYYSYTPTLFPVL